MRRSILQPRRHCCRRCPLWPRGKAPPAPRQTARSPIGCEPPPANAAQLVFEALRRSFALRLQLLACTIGTAEVNELLAPGSRQTVHDRLKAGTLLGILDQGKWRFPLWQFDADGPNGVIDGLAQVLQALQVSNLAKARWLQQPHPVFGGSTPLDLLRHGRLEDVLAEAGQVGRGQD